tara:strand:- start:35657 stop:36091 length:435 start_codon:yes stop_codon:yes gene_type:complete
MTADFTYHRSARSPATFITLALTLAALGALWLWLDAALWIVGFLTLFTLPALWDIITNPQSGLTLDDHRLAWFSGNRHARLRHGEIDHIRLDTRLDFSVRATAVLTTGRKLRLPFESTPPHQAFEKALTARGIATQRHHFTLMQ